MTFRLIDFVTGGFNLQTLQKVPQHQVQRLLQAQEKHH